MPYLRSQKGWWNKLQYYKKVHRKTNYSENCNILHILREKIRMFPFNIVQNVLWNVYWVSVFKRSYNRDWNDLCSKYTGCKKLTF
jgi:hypothetical protein